MTVKELAMIERVLCDKYSDFGCVGCLLYDSANCSDITMLDEYLTPEKEQELMDWYHKNVITYINDFCNKFPNADREYVVNNICVDMIYRGCECNDCEGTVDGCAAHWNSIMENDDV